MQARPTWLAQRRTSPPLRLATQMESNASVTPIGPEPAPRSRLVAGTVPSMVDTGVGEPLGPAGVGLADGEFHRG